MEREEKQKILLWIGSTLRVARERPAMMNGSPVVGAAGFVRALLSKEGVLGEDGTCDLVKLGALAVRLRADTSPELLVEVDEMTEQLVSAALSGRNKTVKTEDGAQFCSAFVNLVHCRKCAEELPEGQSLEGYGRLGVFAGPMGVVVHCHRHQQQVVTFTKAELERMEQSAEDSDRLPFEVRARAGGWVFDKTEDGRYVWDGRPDKLDGQVNMLAFLIASLGAADSEETGGAGSEETGGAGSEETGGAGSDETGGSLKGLLHGLEAAARDVRKLQTEAAKIWCVPLQPEEAESFFDWAKGLERACTNLTIAAERTGKVDWAAIMTEGRVDEAKLSPIALPVLEALGMTPTFVAPDSPFSAEASADPPSSAEAPEQELGG